ncbi:MAG: AsmA family protein [Burkholderiales bacterium PBB1]|nr:MAG: AsmA family protein [Burkholderiales bacterium PBB1]
MPEPQRPPFSPPPPRRRHRFLLGWAALVLAGLVVVGEMLGWPFLAGPLEQALSASLDRRVSLTPPAGDERSSDSFRVRFIGGIHLETPQLTVAAPAWSQASQMLLANGLDLRLRYIDLWRAWRGHPLRIEQLRASRLVTALERLPDGRASWQFAADGSSATPAAPMRLPGVGLLLIEEGVLSYRDGVQDIEVESLLALVDQQLRVTASGHWRESPVKVSATLSGLAAADGDLADSSLPSRLPLVLETTIGRARLRFDGRIDELSSDTSLQGRFDLSGPSLAAVGDPIGVTLPSTTAFHSAGVVVREGDAWRVRVDDATVGASRLNGAFSYASDGAVPMLAGQLTGRHLSLADLGPAVGTTSITSTADPLSPAPIATQAVVKGPGKVLPARPFDLAALRVMNANVLIDIAEVDLNTTALEPLRPLRAHLQLTGGVLSLSDLDARTADGRLSGRLGLDGRGAQALWDADLRWNEVRLERWVRQARGGDAPPYVSGRLNGSATLKGQGRSTAEILASLNGRVRTELIGGAVSHLMVEAAGIDLAQALGVLLKNDDALPLGCAVADLDLTAGALRPRVMVIDTTDSAVWIDGSLSLAAESLDLRAVISPKDFSPLTLRAPVHVRGSFAKPEVSLDKAKLGGQVAASLLLALLNPLAALIPLIDTGDSDIAQRNAAACRRLTQQGARQS